MARALSSRRVQRENQRRPDGESNNTNANTNAPLQVEVADDEEEEEDDDDEDEANAPVCGVCNDDNGRVVVTCPQCASSYHLACHAPALRRRPVLAMSWRCSACTAKGDDETTVVESRRRVRVAQTRTLKQEAAQAELGASAKPAGKRPLSAVEDTQEEEAQAGSKRDTKIKRTTRASSALSEENVEMNNGNTTETIPDNTIDKDKGGIRRATKNGKAPLKRVARRQTSVKVKRAARTDTATSRRKSSRRPRVETDEDEDYEDDTGDNDDDSDYEEDSASVDDEEDDADMNDVSDEDFEKPVKLPSRKKSPAKKPTKTPPKEKAKPKASRRNARSNDGPQSPRRRASSQPAGGQDTGNDSMEPSLDEDREDTTEEEAYFGPTYRIEYAANARAKCKDCEGKLERDKIRISIRVRHSTFGITTYFKHLECTQICWNGLKKNDELAAESSTNPPSDCHEEEPIRGFKSLDPKDQELVRKHMMKNAEEGLLDERRELSEDQYNRKSRMPEKEPSPHLTVPLLPYQREALAWMTAQEAGDYKGGILADEMGMGKTIQAISLILENPRNNQPTDHQVAPKGNSKKAAQKASVVQGGTLVVCPLVAVMQWKSEIERFVERDHLSIYIHHGPKRSDLAEKIASYDIVLTTYSIIESEVRATLGAMKVACKYCKRKFLPERLVLHNKYFCGPDAKKTALQDRQQTKKKKGKRAAGEESESEDDLKKPTKKRVGKKKPVVEILDDSDDDEDVKTSKSAKKGKSPLHQVHWTRIVLDEAHYIKDRKCNTARGVFELKADYRWCLTGTPLQNRIGELFSLIRFLQIKYYAYYHCSKCECQMLDFNFPNGKCELCPHPPMQHFSFFNKKIVVPIQSYGYVAEGKIAMLRLQNEVLQHILLRRTKEGRADDISLPPKLIRIRRDHLDERENDFYQAIYTQSQAQFNTYVSSGTLLNNYAHIFDLLIRLRQAVDHPYLVIYSKSNPALQLPVSAGNGEALSVIARPVVEEKPLFSAIEEMSEGAATENSCTICHEDAEDPVSAKCGHDFCRECVKEFIESLPVGATATCPSCEAALTVDLAPPRAPDDLEIEGGSDSPRPPPRRQLVDLKRYHKHSILHRVTDLDSFQTSTKIEALMQELEIMRERDPSGKAIVFSQFVNMLDIIQHRLTLGGIKCVKLSGNMSMEVRDRTIRAFREDNSVTAFLISLKAGGVALNLTIASHIFLMDPWWNPAAENQAIDRTHRLGQFKPIQATRFIIAGTIEERILKLQEKKRLIFEGTVGASVSAICRLTEEDLRFLFSK